MSLQDFVVMQGLGIENGASIARITTYAGSPEGNVIASVGSLCMDSTNGSLYKKDSGVGNTGWSEISSTAAINALSWKYSVRAASAVPGTLATDFAAGDVVGGVTLVAGDRILIKAQTDAAENGIYVVQATGAPVRATDFDDNTEVKGGSAIAVTEGTYADQIWILTSDDPLVVGTDDLNFAAIGIYTAGTGITIVDGAISATPYTGGDGITVASFGISADLSATGGLELTATDGSGQIAVNVDASNGTTEINGSNELAVRGYAKKTATATGSDATVDSVAVATTAAVKWLISVRNGTSGAYYVEVSGVTNGTLVDHNKSSVLKVGTVVKPEFDVTISGGNMNLVVNATNGYTVQVTRIANLLA